MAGGLAYARGVRQVLLLSLLTLLGACRGSGPPGAMDSAGYHVRGGVVWYLASWTSQAFRVEGADAASFSPLPKSEETYGRDRRAVYFRGKLVPGADPKTFAMHDQRYARDVNNVYIGDTVVCDDPAHFEVVGGAFVKNAHAVYRIEPLRGPPADRIVSDDPAHFRRLAPEASGQFHADSTQLFVGNQLMPDVDPAEFHWLGGNYWRDERLVHYYRDPMPGAPRDGLDILEGGAYARDQQHVYYLGKALPGADPKSFVVTDPRWPKARDDHQGYDQGRVVPLW